MLNNTEAIAPGTEIKGLAQGVTGSLAELRSESRSPESLSIALTYRIILYDSSLAFLKKVFWI